MRIDDLLVEQSQNVAFTYGRFNPPTVAHGQVVFGKLASFGEDYFIFSSQTQNAKKDPLSLIFFKGMRCTVLPKATPNSRATPK